jgi:hypothetical protein
MSCVLVLLMAIDVMVVLLGLVTTSNSCHFGGASTPPFISKGARSQGR